MIQFTKPLFLILLVPLVYYSVALSRRSLAGLSPLRSGAALALRLAIVVLLVMGLAGVRISRQVSQQTVIFVMDVSDSIPKARQGAALDYVNTALKSMTGDQKAGMIVFGGDASVELAPSSARRIERIYSVPDSSNTDISQALGVALASFPEGSSRKIVLLTDGNETLGKAAEQAMLAGSDDVSLDVVPISGDLPREVLLDRMVCPGTVKVGEPFDLKLIAVAKQAAVARVRMLRGGEPVGEKTLELPEGKSVLEFQQTVDRAGSYEFRAILDCDADTLPENNVALGYTTVKGRPRVLYVEGKPGQSKYLADALRSTDIDVDTRDRSGLPNTAVEIRGYDMLVLSDVPAWSMAADGLVMIQSAVRDLGIGLTMVGGDESFGAGGYYDTPVEKALPVDMSVRKTKVLPSLSVVVVMDKSGSMGAPEGGRTKMELANDAAAAVVKLLQPIDKVGVIVCHSSPVVAVPLRPASSKGPIYDQISTIRAEGGGIAVFPSMKQAYDTIRGSGTRQKHIILLADGSDCDDQEGTVPLALQMAGEKITVTTVAIGDGPHVAFLKQVAAAGKGDHYLATQAQDLKAIFTKDVMTISKSLVIEEPFAPQADPSDPVLRGVDLSSVPPLLGYVATSAKPAAAMAMRTSRKDPLLATWQYGLGRSAAFTSDCKARWAKRWLNWPDYGRLWAQVLRSTMRRSASSDFSTTVDVSGGVGNVTIDAADSRGGFLNFLKFGGSVVDPDLKSRPLSIEQTGPGRYSASFEARGVGTYLVNVVRRDGGSRAPETSVVSIPYPPEYKDLEPNTPLLRRLASSTGGTYSPKAEDVFRRNFRVSRASTDLWRALAMAALLLLPLDVAVRRLSMSPAQALEVLAAMRRKLAFRLPRRSRRVERVETVGALLKSKRQRADFGDGGPQAPPAPIEVPPEPRQTPKAPPQQSARPAETQDQESVASRLLDAKRRRKEGK